MAIVCNTMYLIDSSICNPYRSYKHTCVRIFLTISRACQQSYKPKSCVKNNEPIMSLTSTNSLVALANYTQLNEEKYVVNWLWECKSKRFVACGGAGHELEWNINTPMETVVRQQLSHCCQMSWRRLKLLYEPYERDRFYHYFYNWTNTCLIRARVE